MYCSLLERKLNGLLLKRKVLAQVYRRLPSFQVCLAVRCKESRTTTALRAISHVVTPPPLPPTSFSLQHGARRSPLDSAWGTMCKHVRFLLAIFFFPFYKDLLYVFEPFQYFLIIKKPLYTKAEEQQAGWHLSMCSW